MYWRHNIVKQLSGTSCFLVIIYNLSSLQNVIKNTVNSNSDVLIMLHVSLFGKNVLLQYKVFKYASYYGICHKINNLVILPRNKNTMQFKILS